MEQIDGASLNELRDKLEKLYLTILEFVAFYVPWDSQNRKEDGEDALQTAMARILAQFLAMSPKQQQVLLERTTGEWIALFIKAIRNNASQGLRWNRRIIADILPDKDTDATAPDPAEAIERERFITMLKRMAREAMTEKQRSVFGLWLQDMEHEEIADALGISVETSRKRLHDGLARAARAAQKQGVF